MNTRLLIVGGGGAGISAAKTARLAGVAADEMLLVERLPYLGGILTQCLHAGFGVREHQGELNGVEFLRPLLKDFEAAEIPHLLNTSVLEIQPDRTVTLAERDGIRHIQPELLILATGCRERAIGSLPVAGTRPSGILTAGAAQKMVNVNGWDVGNRFVVLGSGDVGLIMAGRFASLGKEVVAVIEQANRCGGLHRNKLRYLDEYAIPLLTHSTITRIFGAPRITGVEVETRDENGTATRFELACDTLITSVGLIPETDVAHEVLSQNDGTPPWLLLAGNARKVRNFIEDVTDDGSAAGRMAAQLLSSAFL
jgi:NADPH-dependent 2,4-dienoyl-CoA reductase/sulfur reductase-like enzyme